MTLTIDTHIPPPLFWNKLKRKGQSSELREALHRLKVGESVFDDTRTANNINVQIYQAQIRTGGLSFSARRETAIGFGGWNDWSKDSENSGRRRYPRAREGSD